MKRLWIAALCCSCLMSAALPAAAQQKLEMNDAEKTERLDVSPVPAPTVHPRLYPGASYHSLHTPDMRYGYLAAGNRNFFYERIGYGPTNVVVVHGGPGLPHNYLTPALEALGQYATVWLFDARGHGLSEQNYPAEPYTMEQLVDDIGTFTQAAGIQHYTLFGHSFGGMVALKYATTHPAGLDRLILADTAPSVAYAAQFEDNLKKSMTSDDFARYEKVRADESIPADERLRRALRIVYPLYWYDAPKAYYLDQDINQMNLNAMAADQIWSSDGMSYDVTKDLKDIDVPTLVMVGRYDIVMPVDQAKIIADGIPDSKLVVFEHSGVYPFYEDNYLFTQYIQLFLTYYAN